MTVFYGTALILEPVSQEERWQLKENSTRFPKSSATED